MKLGVIEWCPAGRGTFCSVVSTVVSIVRAAKLLERFDRHPDRTQNGFGHFVHALCRERASERPRREDFALQGRNAFARNDRRCTRAGLSRSKAHMSG